VRAFQIGLDELHQDTTTVTFSGDYAGQPPVDQPGRPPRITFGYNKDHRPDLKQLLYSIAITADGAVPVHCKTYDGNTTDDQVHRDTWAFLRQIIGHGDFLYVADSKLCTRDNMSYIAGRQGRFLTVMPRTRSEDGWFRDYLQTHPLEWREVHREPNPRRRDGPLPRPVGAGCRGAGAGGALRRVVPAADQRRDVEPGGGVGQVQVPAVRGEAARATQECVRRDAGVAEEHRPDREPVVAVLCG